MSRNCPDAQRVRSTRTGRAPGLTSFSVQPDFAAIDELRELAASTATSDGLALHNIDLGCLEALGATEESSYDASGEYVILPITTREGRYPSYLGDLYADHALRTLCYGAPYCCPQDGDEGPLCCSEDLCVTRVSDDYYVIAWDGGPVTEFYVPVSDICDAGFDLVRWFRIQVATVLDHPQCLPKLQHCGTRLGDALAEGAQRILHEEIEHPTFGDPDDPWVERFYCFRERDKDFVHVSDAYLDFSIDVPVSLLLKGYFDLPNYFARQVRRAHQPRPFSLDELDDELSQWFLDDDRCGQVLELYAVAPPSVRDTISHLQRNAGTPRDFRRMIPEPIVVVVQINEHPARALLDSGSLADFMSAKLAHQLGVSTFELEKPLPVHLAVQGSRAKINSGCKAEFAYQSIREDRYFDVVNLLNYDLILGTPFFFQHKVSVGFNPITVDIGSSVALPIEGKQLRVLESRAAELLESHLEVARCELREYAAPICKEASDSPLPPLRAINHTIPLKDEGKVYSWRPSRCPDALRALWCEKRDAYLLSGRWRMVNARNASPMLLLKKPGTGVADIPARLRVVCDLRERNSNTVKVASPLPDMEGILRRAARKPFRSLIDGKDAYEQIRIHPSDVPKTAMTTPDGTMVSLVLQQGDCNAVATYQSLMNHIFGPYIAVFMDVYLDDIIIYSDTIRDHVSHVKLIIDILKREELYLSATKLHFLCAEMKILGRIVDDQGIRMDPDKVDCVVNWKVPTTKELLRGFLGSVGYLADDIAMVRIPMGILTSLTGSESSFRWDYTHQRAFDEIKRLVQAHRDHRRTPLDYSADAPRIWLITDGSHGGVAGVVAQGVDFRRARVAAFFSAKLTAAQMNYPVHEIEMLAGVEAMQRHKDILLGCHFTWLTDHKGLVHLLNQRNLSGRQARWLEKIAEFDFGVEYLPGVENVLADALSRLYSADAPGTVRAASEYTMYDEGDAFGSRLARLAVSSPVFAGLEAMAVRTRAQVRRPRDIAAVAPVGLPAGTRDRRVTVEDVPESPMLGPAGGSAGVIMGPGAGAAAGGLPAVVRQPGAAGDSARAHLVAGRAASVTRVAAAGGRAPVRTVLGEATRSARVAPAGPRQRTGATGDAGAHLRVGTAARPRDVGAALEGASAGGAQHPRSMGDGGDRRRSLAAAGGLATPSGRPRTVAAVAPAESGRPETSREFARRIRRVVLHGPRGGREGEGLTASSGEVTTHSPGSRDAAPPLEGVLAVHDRGGGTQEATATAPAALGSSVGAGAAGPLTGSLLEHVAESSDGVDLRNDLRGRYAEDPFYKMVLDNPRHYKNFVHMDGLVYLRDRGVLFLCIPNVRINERSVREIVILHAHSLLAHLGSFKTLGLLRDHVWWKTMAADVQAYCDTCMTCKRSKPSNQKPYGLLNPLPVPSSPWDAIGIDFVGPLPDSKNRDGTYDSITVIIDLLTSMVHLVPSRTDYTARQVAELVFAEVYKHHGMPKAIVSDRDVLFTSTFWAHLHELVGVELRMSSAYHPESDGSTERANRTITQMLRQCVGPTQKDWVARLPAIEFAINLARSESTGYAPFFLNTGRMPRSMIWDNAGTDEFPGVRVFAQRVKAAVMSAHDSIIASRVKQTRDANRRRRPAPFVTGDLVYLSTKNISLPKGLARKLAPKYMGPYKILRDYGNNSFKLDLPPNLKRRGIHDVFHASLLRVHEPNDDRLFPGRLDSQVMELEDRDNEWAIDRLLSHRGQGLDAIVEALWKSGDRTWVPASAIKNLPAWQHYLEALGVADAAHLPLGTGAPPSDPQLFAGYIGLGAGRHIHIKPAYPVPRNHHSSPPCHQSSHTDAESRFSRHVVDRQQIRFPSYRWSSDRSRLPREGQGHPASVPRGTAAAFRPLRYSPAQGYIQEKHARRTGRVRDLRCALESRRDMRVPLLRVRRRLGEGHCSRYSSDSPRPLRAAEGRDSRHEGHRARGRESRRDVQVHSGAGEDHRRHDLGRRLPRDFVPRQENRVSTWYRRDEENPLIRAHGRGGSGARRQEAQGRGCPCCRAFYAPRASQRSRSGAGRRGRGHGRAGVDHRSTMTGGRM